MLLKLIDGGILNITNDKDYFSGCETCDYGSCYTNYFDIEMTNFNIHIEASQMYEYPLSDEYMMKIILPNIEVIQQMTEDAFVKWLEVKFNDFNSDKLEFVAKNKIN